MVSNTSILEFDMTDYEYAGPRKGELNPLPTVSATPAKDRLTYPDKNR
jgi:hypothetical protein